MALIFWGLNVFDWATTMTAIKLFGIDAEQNPFMRALIDKSEWLYMSVKLFGIIPVQLIFWAITKSISKHSEWDAKNAKLLYKGLYVVLIIIYLAAILNNIQKIY